MKASDEETQPDDEASSEDLPEAPPQQFQPGSAASWLNSATQESASEKEEKAQEPSVFRADAPAFYPKAMHDTFALRAALGLPGSTPPSELVPEKPSCFLEPEARVPILEETLPLPPNEAPPPAPIAAEDATRDSDDSSTGSRGDSSDEAPQFFPLGGLDDDTDAASEPLVSAPGLGPPMEPPPPAPHSVLASIAVVGLDDEHEGSTLRDDERLRRRCQRFGLAHELPCINFDSDHRHPPEVLKETILRQRLVIEELLDRLEASAASKRL